MVNFGVLLNCYLKICRRCQGTLELGQARHDGENHLPLGIAGVDPLLVRNEVHATALEFLQGIDERLGRSGEAIIAPDEHHIHPPFAHRLEQPPVVAPILGGAGGVIDELLYYLDLKNEIPFDSSTVARAPGTDNEPSS